MAERSNRLKLFFYETRRRIERMIVAMGKLRHWLPGRHVVIPTLILIWIISGIFTVSPADLGAVYRWGRLDRIVEPGPHYRLPWPMERMRACAVEHVRRFEINFYPQTGDGQGLSPVTNGNAWLLTVDEQLAALSIVVQTRVSSVEDYFSQVNDPDQTVYNAAQASLSTVVAQYSLETVLTDGKFKIEKETLAALQTLLDRYKCGLQVVAVKLTVTRPPMPVQKAFADMTQAREAQRQAIINAAAYENKALPLAQGQAEQIVQAAEAYKIRQINQAQGDAHRFLARLDAYQQAPTVTRKRLYLNAMAHIAGQSFKVVLPSADPSILPTLPLDKFIPLAGHTPMPQQESE
jgi:membrane protease subunit HflK